MTGGCHLGLSLLSNLGSDECSQAHRHSYLDCQYIQPLCPAILMHRIAEGIGVALYDEAIILRSAQGIGRDIR